MRPRDQLADPDKPEGPEYDAWLQSLVSKWSSALSDGSEEKKATSTEAGTQPSLEDLTEADVHTIKVDIPRTRASDPIFKNPPMHERLQALLVGFCHQEGVRYMQGLHEVAAIFAYLGSLAKSPEDGKALACMVSFVQRYVPCFYDGASLLVLHVSLLFFRQLLLYHHPDLHNHLEEVGVSPFIYATPWFITLFASTTPLHVVLKLWDKYVERGEMHFMPFLAVAMIVSEKSALMSLDEDDVGRKVSRAGISSLALLEEVWAGAEAMHLRTPRSFMVRMSRVLGKVRQCRTPDTAMSERVLARVEQERRLVVMANEVVHNYARTLQQSSKSANRSRPVEPREEDEAPSQNNEDATAKSQRVREAEPAGSAAAAPDRGGDVAPADDQEEVKEDQDEGSDVEREEIKDSSQMSVEAKSNGSACNEPRGPATVPSIAGPKLRMLLLDVRTEQEYKALHMPNALHFYPRCLRKLAEAYSSGSTGKGGERLVAALSAVKDAINSQNPPSSPAATGVVAAPAKQAEWADSSLLAEVFDHLCTSAAEQWGEDWVSESGAAHLMILGGEADWDSPDKACKAHDGGAVVPLFEVLTEYMSIARVSVVLGGAATLHKEAAKRAIQLDGSQSKGAAKATASESTDVRDIVGSARRRLQAAADSLPPAEVVGGRLNGFLQSGTGALKAWAGGAAKGLTKASSSKSHGAKKKQDEADGLLEAEDAPTAAQSTADPGEKHSWMTIA